MATPSGPVSELAEKYRTQLHSTLETVRKRGGNINQNVTDLAQQIKTQLQNSEEAKQIPSKLSQAIQDMTPVEKAGTHTLLLETYLWTAVCLLGMSIGQLFGTYILRYLLGAIFNTWITIALAYLVVPLWFYFKEFVTEKTEAERRMALLGISVVLGILSGHNLGDLRLSFFSPPTVILPLSIALIAGFLSTTIYMGRSVCLGVTIGGAVFIYLIFGIMFRSIHIYYILWTVAVTLMAAMDLQIKLGKIQDGTFNMALAQFSTILISLIANAIIMRVFATHKSKKKA